MGAIIPNFEARPRFWDIVSIESSTQMTIKLRDVFGAVITMIG